MNEEITYPCFRVYEELGIVVLFTEEGKGVVVRASNDKRIQVGYESTHWAMFCFKPFVGSIEVIENTHNIPAELLDYAYQTTKHVAPISTGGGCDYLYREMASGKQVVISDDNDVGLNNKLSDGGCVTIYSDSGWHEGITFTTDTIKDAIDLVDGMAEVNEALKEVPHKYGYKYGLV